MNPAFFIYFILMFCFYTKTIIQLFAQIFIILYTLISLANKKMKITNSKRVLQFLLWYGGFVLLIALSKMWAYSSFEGHKPVLTQFRIFVICFCIVLFSNNKEKSISILQSFISAFFVMGLYVIITSLASGGGIINRNFGAAIGQHRNQIGAIAAPLTFISYYYHLNYTYRSGLFYSVFFAILTIFTGSIASIFQLCLIFLLNNIFFQKNSKKLANTFCGILLISIVLLIILWSVPILKEQILSRIIGVFFTIIQNSSDDISALGRNYYRKIAYDMFIARPVLGWGVEGFICFVRDNPHYLTTAYMSATNSHCNYAEIASSLGIVGLMVWYVPILMFLIEAIKNRNKTALGKLQLSIYISLLVLDYARIIWSSHLSMYFLTIIVQLIMNNSFVLFEKQNHANTYFE